MASSVSSERAFSSAGITISKRRNRLKGDIVEALQYLKCAIRQDLLFREDPSSTVEVEMEDGGSAEGKNDSAGWDEMVDDLQGDDGEYNGDEDEDVQILTLE